MIAEILFVDNALIPCKILMYPLNNNGLQFEKNVSGC